MNLSDFDGERAYNRRRLRSMTRQQWFALPAPALPCGYFALHLTDGGVRWFRIRLDKQGVFIGRRTLARLTGPDLESREWEAIATIEADGPAIFKRWRNDWCAKHASILWLLLHGERVEGYSVVCDVRCRWCLKKLTGEESIAAQLGKKCMERVGITQ